MFSDSHLMEILLQEKKLFIVSNTIQEILLLPHYIYIVINCIVVECFWWKSTTSSREEIICSIEIQSYYKRKTTNISFITLDVERQMFYECINFECVADNINDVY